MSRRYRNPETERLEISEGDWLLVKKHLTAGESKQMFRRMLDPSGGVDPVNVGTSKLVTYVLDWSIDDQSGKRVPLMDQSDDAKAAAFDNLPEDDYQEILRTIETHMTKMSAERSAEKNARSGETTSSLHSTSVNISVGPTTPSNDSILMSTA